MKRIVFVFLTVVAACVLASCVKDIAYPSPLEGISVEDVTVEADTTKKVIKINSPLRDVEGKAIDMSTGREAEWVLVDVSDRKVTLTLTVNTTILDRQAEVTLFFNGTRTDVLNTDLTVQFKVIQRKYKQFEGINIQDLSLSHERGDTTLLLAHQLTNVKFRIRDLDGKEVKWCTARLYDNRLLNVKVEEHRSAGSRQALVTLLPSGTELTADSITAQVSFLVTQLQNPALDGANSAARHTKRRWNMNIFRKNVCGFTLF